MPEPIFRKAALQRLNSPEQLDHLMQVLRWRGWVVLLACGILVLAALLWGLLGDIKLCVQGRGILLNSAGVAAVESASGGMVARIDVHANQTINKGDLLGLVANPGLEQQVLQAEAELDSALQKEKKLREFYAQSIARSEATTGKNTENIQFRITSLREHQKFLENLLDADKRLRSGGVAREDEGQGVRVNLDQTLKSLNECHFQILNLENQLEVQRGEAEKTILDLEVMRLTLAKKLDSLRRMTREMTEVRAPAAGRVLELCVEHGSVLPAGGLFALIGRQEGEPEGLIFFQAETGRKLRPGMKAYLYPSTVMKEEYGGITGEVLEVSDYLVSMEGLGRLLNNQMMAQNLIDRQGPLVSVRIQLNRDEDGALLWSSSRGPQTKLEMGTLCDSRVVVERKRPLNLVIPHVLDTFSVGGR